MRILHIGDIHFSRKNAPELDVVAPEIIKIARKRKPDMIVCTGDVFDKVEPLTSPVVRVAIAFFRVLSNIAPVVIVRGTPSHDGIHGLDFLSSVATIVEYDSVFSLFGDLSNWDASYGWARYTVRGTSILFVPSFPKNASDELVLSVKDVAKNSTIMFSHGSISGAVNEHGVPVDLFDVEWDIQELKSLGPRLIGMGHIHKPQILSSDPIIYYAGSVGRFHFGEQNDKNLVFINIHADRIDIELEPLPASPCLHYDSSTDISVIRAALEHGYPNTAVVVHGVEPDDHKLLRLQIEYRGRVRLDMQEKKDREHHVAFWGGMSVEELVWEYVVENHKDWSQSKEEVSQALALIASRATGS
jgi:exonuclease SbcD